MNTDPMFGDLDVDDEPLDLPVSFAIAYALAFVSVLTIGLWCAAGAAQALNLTA